MIWLPSVNSIIMNRESSSLHQGSISCPLHGSYPDVDNDHHEEAEKVICHIYQLYLPLAPPTGQTDTWQGGFVLTHFPQWGPNLKIYVLPIFSSATIKHATSNHSGKNKKQKKLTNPFWEKALLLSALLAQSYWPKIWAPCLKLKHKNTLFFNCY